MFIVFDSLVTHSHSPPFSLARKYKILENGFASPNKMRGRISIIFNYILKKKKKDPKSSSEEKVATRTKILQKRRFPFSR